MPQAVTPFATDRLDTYAAAMRVAAG